MFWIHQQFQTFLLGSAVITDLLREPMFNSSKSDRQAQDLSPSGSIQVAPPVVPWDLSLQFDQALRNFRFQQPELAAISDDPRRAPMPSTEKRVGQVVEALLRDPRNREVLAALLQSGKLVGLADALLLPHQKSLSPEQTNNLKLLLENSLNTTPETSENQVYRTAPLAYLYSPRRQHKIGPPINSSSMAIIGDGPAAIILARFRHEMGFLPEATKIFSPKGTLGGIWTREEQVIWEGHNTFRTAHAFGAALYSRKTVLPPGESLQGFLAEIISQVLPQFIIKASVKSVDRNGLNNKFIVATDSGHNLEFDSVCICTGNKIPKPLNSDVMKTNAAPGMGITINRWQNKIDPSQYPEFHNASVLLVGLGNSTMAMVGEFIKMRKAGVNVTPVILTQHSAEAIRSPKEIFFRADGSIEWPLFRRPSDLSRIAGDIKEIRDRYDYALKNGWIIAEVKSWELVSDRENPRHPVSVLISHGEFKRVVQDVHQIYALIGYANSPKQLQRFGCNLADASGTVDYESETGMVRSLLKNYDGGLYVLGAAASSRDNRNEEVIPGIMSKAGNLLFTEIVRQSRLNYQKDL